MIIFILFKNRESFTTNNYYHPFFKRGGKKALFQMNHNYSPSLMDFHEFYQGFWHVPKTQYDDDVCGIPCRALCLFIAYFSTIILLSMNNDTKQFQQYIPICLLNVSFEILTKLATIRVTKIAQWIVKPSETMFLPGRNIM